MESMTERARQRSSFNAWYDRNAASYNAERKRRYHEDPEIREEARLAAANYRKRVAEGGVELPALRGGLYTSARVAALLGISTQTLRNWEARGMIPKPTLPGKHRLYTKRQVELLSALIAAETRSEFEIARTNLFVEWEEAGE